MVLIENYSIMNLTFIDSFWFTYLLLPFMIFAARIVDAHSERINTPRKKSFLARWLGNVK